MNLNGLSTAAIWASLALVLANWRLVQLERLLPKPAPPGLNWVRSLSLLSLITLLAWGLGYGNLDPAYARLVHQFTCLSVAASWPMTFEAICDLVERRPSDGVRVTVWVTMIISGFLTAALGYGEPIARSLPAFGANYSIASVAGWVLYGSFMMIATLIGSVVVMLKLTERAKRHLIRPVALGALLMAATLVNDQLSSRQLIVSPYLTVWGVWLWVLSFALTFERMTKQRVNDLQQRTARALERTRARSAFLANMSHELRTPLGGLMGLTELLLADQTLTSRQQQLAHALQGSSHRLRLLIDEVLELEKLELGASALTGSAFAVAPWLESIKRRAQDLRSSDDVAITSSPLPDELVESGLVGDADRLGKAILNLLANALRHTQRGSVNIALRLRSLRDGVADLRISVRDTGSRIGRPTHSLRDTMHRDRLSDQLADDPNLSLALALRLTELIGGRLHLQTASGLGTTYTLSIRLPYAPSDQLPPKRDKGHEPHPAKHREDLLSRLRILVIDDHPVNRIVTATPLEQVGAAVDTAPSAMEGLKLIEAHAYDLLLIDLHMPEMDGVQATELLRRHEAEGRCAHQDRLPVIAVSADVTEAARTACREVGMIGFIAKPYARHTLIQAVAETLGRDQTVTSAIAGDASVDALSATLAMVDGNRALAADILDEHLKRTPALIAQLDAARNTDDFETMAMVAHALKGSLLTLGFHGAGEAARTLEEAARRNDREGCEPSTQALLTQLERVEALISDGLARWQRGADV